MNELEVENVESAKYSICASAWLYVRKLASASHSHFCRMVVTDVDHFDDPSMAPWMQL